VVRWSDALEQNCPVLTKGSFGPLSTVGVT